MKKLIKFILYSFIGLIVSLVLILVSEGIHTIVTCIIAGLAVALFIYFVSEKTGMRMILAIVSFIIVFFLYLALYNYVNEEADSMFGAIIVFGAPYILAAYALIEGSNE